MTYAKKAQFSTKWDIRTGSPRKLWRALHDFLDDHGFEHEYEELKPEGSPIEGTATFSDCLSGQRDREERAYFWFLRTLIGVLLLLTIILIPLGLALIRSRLKIIRTIVEIDVEGEVYRARGADIDTSRAAEVLDVVADTRVTLQAWSGEPIGNGEDEIRLTEDEREFTEFKQEFEELSYRLEEILPRLSLPGIKLLSQDTFIDE